MLQCRQPQQLRKRHRIEANLWAYLAAKITNKTWLADYSADIYARLTDHILGKRCAELEINLTTAETADGPNLAPKPPWSLVLSYEYQLRKAAFKSVREEGSTLVQAFEAAIKDPELRELHFTSPLALLPRGEKRRDAGGGAGRDHDFPGTPNKHPAPKRRPKGKGKGTGKGKDTVARTPDGRMICLAYQTPNGCPGGCNMLHVCYGKGCQGNHPFYQCPKRGGAAAGRQPAPAPQQG